MKIAFDQTEEYQLVLKTIIEGLETVRGTSYSLSIAINTNLEPFSSANKEGYVKDCRGGMTNDEYIAVINMVLPLTQEEVHQYISNKFGFPLEKGRKVGTYTKYWTRIRGEHSWHFQLMDTWNKKEQENAKI